MFGRLLIVGLGFSLTGCSEELGAVPLKLTRDFEAC